MGQKKLEEAVVGNSFPAGFVGTTTAAAILRGDSAARVLMGEAGNTAKVLMKGTTEEVVPVRIRRDAAGRVVAQKLIVGEREREQWGWWLSHVERVRRARERRS